MNKQDRIGLRVLRSELSITQLARVGASVAWSTVRREPFGHLPAANTERERLSRGQIGPAILLYRALLSCGLDEARTYAITRDVVLQAGADFLSSTLGELRRADLAAFNDEERWSHVRSLGARFFNATMRWEHVDADKVAFTVTACRFPALCSAAGVPQLAPLFCEVDKTYFGSVEPNVSLTRPGTIAEGASECPFTLRWTGPDGDISATDD